MYAKIPSRYKRVVWLLGVVLFMGMACKFPAGLEARLKEPTATSTLTPSPTPTIQPLPPSVVETKPASGSQIALSGKITIYFNQVMDRASVEDAFRVTPETTGVLEWQGASTVTFFPDQALEPKETLTISIETTARAANGLSLLEPFVANYSTPGYLTPTHFLPAPGGEEIDPSAAIMVAFNQPVVALGLGEGEGPQAFQITPSVPGEGEWINTSTYMFSPETALAGGVEYTVQLNTEITSTADAPIPEGTRTSWTFRTLSPALLSFEPESQAEHVPLDAEVKFTFNQAMDEESLSALLSLQDEEGELVRGRVELSEDLKTAAFIPYSLLDRGETYSVLLPGEVQAAGGTDLGTDHTWQFKAVEELGLLESSPGRGSSTTVHQGVILYFNSPLNLENIQDKITIKPEITNLRASWVDSDNALRITGDYAALENYTLTIAESLLDKWGSALSEPIEIRFSTRAFSSNLVVTQGANDLFLRGDENTIPAQGTNLSSVVLSVGSIPPEKYAAVLGQERYQALQNYSPPDEQIWRRAVSVPGDASYEINLPLNPAGSALPPGLYRYQVSSRDLPYNPAPYLLAVSHNHLTLKVSPHDLLVWAVDLRTGEPVANTPVQIYNQEGQVIFSGNTNAEGVFSAAFSTPQNLYQSSFYAVLGNPGEDNFAVSSSTWQQGTEPYLFSLRSDYDPDRMQTYLYTDRPIYRPGQIVFFRVVQRELVDFGYSLPEEKDVECSIVGPQGEMKTLSLDLSEFGTAHGQYELPAFTEPGYYRLESGNSTLSFHVAEYRKPEIDLGVEISPEVALKGQNLGASVNARYYFDAPAGNVDLEWNLTAQPAPFLLPGYQVGVLENRAFGYPRPYSPGTFKAGIDSGEGETSRDGTWSLDLSAAELDKLGSEIDLPATLVFEATVQDESGFPISARAETLLHPSEFYIGVKPGAWISKAGEEANFDLKVVDWEKNSAGIQYLQAALKKVSWERKGEAPYNIYYEKQLELISEASVRTDPDGRSQFSSVPPSPGMYQIEVSGGDARTEILTWIGGAGQVTWPAVSNQKLDLVVDQDSYQPGEMARVFIPNPFSTWSQALVTVERDQIHTVSTYKVDGTGKTITLPLSEEEVPNVYLSVTLLGEDENGNLDFRQGYVNVPVEPEEQLLNVELISEPEQTKPGGEVTLDIQVTDSEGQPVQGEFSLAVVDKAVLALADPNAKDISEAFFGERPLAVRLGLPMGIHAGRELTLPGGIGGGGGAVVLPVRDQFPDTNYWNAEVITDERGQATVTVRLPDNLTTWQVQTRGITKDSKVGQEVTDVVTRKELLVRPVTPRFLVAGDHLRFAAIVHNNTEEDLSADVSVQVKGMRLDEPSRETQVVDIQSGGRVRVEWWGTVEEVSQVEMVFSAKSGTLSDAVQPYQGALPVLQYTASRTYGTSGVIQEEGTRLEVVDLPRTFDPTRGTLDLELSPSLAAVMTTALDALQDDDHESTLGMMSQLLPDLTAYRALKELGLEYPELETRLEESLPQILETITGLQNEDGGWSWWRGGNSDQTITSYLLFGMAQAREAGVFVDADVIQRANEYLVATLPSPDMLSRAWQYDQLAFQYFALQAADAANVNGVERLYEYREQLSPWGKAMLGWVLESKTPGDERAESIFSNLESNAFQSATGVHWEEGDDPSHLHSAGTTTAIVTYTLARYDPQARSLPNAVRYLTSTRAPNGSWRSDYETAWSVLALSEVMKGTGEFAADFPFKASLNGKEIISGRADGPSLLSSISASTPVGDLLSNRPNALEIEHGQGNGPLYYRSHLTVSRPAADVTPYGNGMSLSRAYSFAEDGDDVTFTQHGSTAELIKVHLTLSVEEDTYYLRVKDTIPAGAEILDTRLKTTQQGEAEFDVSSPFRNGWGWWSFNPPRVYDDHITWSSDFLPAGTYQLTYTLALNVPGEYQVLPARAWQTYFPEIQALSAGDEFIITTAQD